MENFFTSKRKHSLDDEPSKKRVRLDSLLLQLSLSNDEKVEAQKFNINPLLSMKKQRAAPLDKFMSERIIQEFTEKLKRDQAVGFWTPPLAIVAFHFERWVRRLFNSFVRGYNLGRPDKKPVRPFRDYFKILELVGNPQIQFTMQDLWNILRKENALEQKRIRKRRRRSVDEDEVNLSEVKYAYWDRFAQISEDLEMEDVGEEMVELEMEVESP